MDELLGCGEVHGFVPQPAGGRARAGEGARRCPGGPRRGDPLPGRLVRPGDLLDVIESHARRAARPGRAAARDAACGRLARRHRPRLCSCCESSAHDVAGQSLHAATGASSRPRAAVMAAGWEPGAWTYFDTPAVRSRRCRGAGARAAAPSAQAAAGAPGGDVAPRSWDGVLGMADAVEAGLVAPRGAGCPWGCPCWWCFAAAARGFRPAAEPRRLRGICETCNCRCFRVRPQVGPLSCAARCPLRRPPKQAWTARTCGTRADGPLRPPRRRRHRLGLYPGGRQAPRADGLAAPRARERGPAGRHRAPCGVGRGRRPRHPGPAGLGYLERVCTSLPGLGVVVCTGRSTVAQRVRGLRLGADDWLTKPCHPEELIARVEAVVRRRRRAEARVDAAPGRRRRGRDPRRPVPGLRRRRNRST